MTNCVNTGTISEADKAGGKFTWYCQLVRFEPGTLTMTNCYDLSGFYGGEDGQQGDQGSLTTSAPLTSGELCYKLNDDQSNIVWTQAIGTDGYPMPLVMLVIQQCMMQLMIGSSMAMLKHTLVPSMAVLFILTQLMTFPQTQLLSLAVHIITN